MYPLPGSLNQLGVVVDITGASVADITGAAAGTAMAAGTTAAAAAAAAIAVGSHSLEVRVDSILLTSKNCGVEVKFLLF